MYRVAPICDGDAAVRVVAPPLLPEQETVGRTVGRKDGQKDERNKGRYKG